VIAYTGCIGGGCGIWTTTERGYAPREACCQLARGASDTGPDWSPDGARLAFTSREEGSFEIYVVNASGAGRTRLTLGGGTNVAPTWSPDGQWIAYLSDRGGQWAVWLVRPDRPGEIVKLMNISGTIEDAPNRRMDWAVGP
jgi:dipeptidyl aminopeptidase/acylaminoacyl peptidase